MPEKEANDFIFSKAMRDPEICKEVLGVLFGKKIKEVCCGRPLPKFSFSW